MDDALDYQGRRVEVEEQADLKASRFQIGFQLGKVYLLKGLDRFQFQDDPVLNHEVQPVNANIDFLEKYVNFFLRLKRDLAVREGDFHCPLIDRLQEAWPESLVDFHRSPQNAAR